MREFRPQLLATEFSLFLAVQLLGLWIGWKIFHTLEVPKMETSSSIIWFLVIFVIATGSILLALRFLKFKMPFGLLFAFLIFVGANIVFSTFISNTVLAFTLAAVVVGFRFLWPTIITQNIAMILAIAGVSAQLGVLLTVPAVIILLIVLSIYDFWAVFKSKHMISMAKGLIQRGMAPMIIMPSDWRAMTVPMKQVEIEKLKKKTKKPLKYMMLGTGDLAFPLVFAVSALAYGLISSFAVIAGALAGLVVIHFLMMSKKFPALPALPPIAAGSIIAFGISLLII